MRKNLALLLAVAFGLGALLAAGAGTVRAAYPDGPIRVIVTHGAGGAVDTAARLVQPYLQKYLDVPVVIENMPGAGGNISRAYVYKQPPDGYTLLISLQPSMAAGQIITGAKFETLEFSYVFNVTGGNYDGVAVPADSPWKTIEDLKAASQKQPLTCSGAGIGTNPYILAMLLREKAGINLTFVPFNSGAEAALAVAGGQTQMGTAQLDSLWPLHESGKLRVLAVDGPQRDKSHPEFPSLVELGYPGVKLDSLIGLYAPPGLPQERLEVLVAAFRKVVVDPKFLEAAKTAGISLKPMEPEEFHRTITDMFGIIKEMEPILKPGRKP